MPLAAVLTSQNTGGGIYATSTDPLAAPKVNGLSMLRVGDQCTCPGSSGAGPGGYGNHPVDQLGNRQAMVSVILDGSTRVSIGGIPVAQMGSNTTCGHPISLIPQTSVNV